MKKTKLSKVFSLAILLIPICSGCNKETLKEPGAEVITIYIKDFEDWSNDYFIDAIDRYNDNVNDGVEVVYKMHDESSYTLAVQSARQDGDAPDIYMVDYSNLWQEIDMDYILPLNDVYDASFFEDYTDTALDATTFYKKIYAVPYCLEPSMLLFYSKSMFEKAGVEKEPQTYEEMLDTCEKLSKVINKNKGQDVLATPIGVPMGWANVGQFYNASNGNLPISDDWSKSLVATDNMEGYKTFLEYYTSLYSKGYASTDDVLGGYNEIINELCEGRVAMTFAGSYAVGQIYQDYIAKGYLDNADDIGCCLTPRLNQNLGATANGGWSFVLDSSTNTKVATNEKVQGKTHTELAADFVKWYTTDATVATGFFELGKCSKQTGFKSIQTKLDDSQENNPFYEVIKEAANTAVPLPKYPYQITDACAQMITTLSSAGNKNSVEKVIGLCHSEIEKQIEILKLAEPGKNPNSND